MDHRGMAPGHRGLTGVDEGDKITSQSEGKMVVFHAQGLPPGSQVAACLDQMFQNPADALHEVHHILGGHWKRGETVTVSRTEGVWRWDCSDGSRYVVVPRTVH